MAKILDMPKLSPTMEEGVLSAWHKKEGDAVAVDDLLAEVETDKATMEFRAFDAGTLLKILVPPGSQVKLGQPVAILGAPGEDVSSLAAQAPAQTPASSQAPVAAPAPVPVPATPTATATATATPTPTSAPTATPTATSTPKPIETLAPQAQRRPPVADPLDRTSYAPEPAGNGHVDGGRVLASPYVRKVAREMGLDLQGAQGSGPGGRVVPADLASMRGPAPSAPGAAPLARVPPASPAAPAAPSALEGPEVRPLSPMRKTIARRRRSRTSTCPSTSTWRSS
jgi:pyruvate dehydrogenase E2 component (dihydrolipoamide acetyltransferase)